LLEEVCGVVRKCASGEDLAGEHNASDFCAASLGTFEAVQV